MYDELVKRLRREAVYLPEKFSKNAELLDVLMKAADAIEELQTYADLYKDMTEESQRAARKVIDSYPKWIPLTERLPEYSGDYLVYSIGGNWEQLSTIEIAFWNDKNFIVQSFFAVTHWMPLPEPPDHIGEATEMVEKESES